MSRIGKAYEARFRALLLRLRARKLESGVAQLTGSARKQASAQGVSLVHALSNTYEHLRSQVKCWEQRPGRNAAKRLAPDQFLCDAGLGGLAKWLRVAGYDATWFPDIDDAELLRKAETMNATVLTTDSLMMERGVLRDAIIPALWLPPALTRHEQLGLVLREFGLTIRAPRCMHCGGELIPVEKESVHERIPPKTWRWIHHYFVCARCGKLFWRGTHWERIQRQLQTLGEPAKESPACSSGPKKG